MAGIVSGQANTVIYGSSTSTLYVGGMITTSSNSYTTLTEITSGSLTWNYRISLSPSLRLRRLYYDSSGQNIYGCSDSSASSMIAITIIPTTGGGSPGSPGCGGPAGVGQTDTYTDSTNNDL
jgi:hypothetical protein